MLVADLRNFGDGGDVAFHGEDAVHYDQLAVVGAYFLKHALEVFGIIVLEAAQFAVGEAAAVEDAGVVELVHYGEITFAHQGRDDAEVHLVAGGVNKGGLAALELGQLGLQLGVQHGVAVEKAGARHAGAEFVHRVYGGLLHAGVVGQAQVIVGPEHDELLTLDGDLRGLLALEFLEIGVDAGGDELFYNVEIAALIENVGHIILIFYHLRGRS